MWFTDLLGRTHAMRIVRLGPAGAQLALADPELEVETILLPRGEPPRGRTRGRSWRCSSISIRRTDVDTLARACTRLPRWVDRLMWLRNRLVGRFGLQVSQEHVQRDDGGTIRPGAAVGISWCSHAVKASS